MLRLTGDVEKTARMSACPAEPCAAGRAREPRGRGRGPAGPSSSPTATRSGQGDGDGAGRRVLQGNRGSARHQGARCCTLLAERRRNEGGADGRPGRTPGATSRRTPASRAASGEDPAARAGERHPEGSRRPFKSRGLGSMSNMEKTALIDKLGLESDRPKRAHHSLRISKSSYEYCRAKLRARTGTPSSGPTSGGYSTAPAARGYRYVHNELREGGVVVSEKVVRRLMAERGLQGRLPEEEAALQLLQGGRYRTRPQPGEARLPRGRTKQAVAHRHHRVQAAQRGEGVPQPGHRLLRRPRRGMADRKAPRTRRSPTAPWRTRAGRLPGPAPGLPLQTGDAITDGPVDRHMRGTAWSGPCRRAAARTTRLARLSSAA